MCERVSLQLECSTTRETVQVGTAGTTSSIKLSEAIVPSPQTAADKPNSGDLPFPTLRGSRVRIPVGCGVPDAHKVLEEG